MGGLYFHKCTSFHAESHFMVRLHSLLVYLSEERQMSLGLHYQMNSSGPCLLTSSNQRTCCWTHLSLALTCLLTKSTVKLYSQLPLPSRSPSISCVLFIRALGKKSISETLLGECHCMNGRHLIFEISF